MNRKFWILALFLVQIGVMALSQSPCIIKNGKVVYECGLSFDDSTFKSNYAALGNNYIRNYQGINKLMSLYLCLDINSNDSTPRFELSYDNLNGNSIENQLFKRNRKYDKPGLRIKIYSNKYHPSEFMKLLSYGLNNTKRLKKLRKHVMAIDSYSRPDSVSLSPEEIKIILSTNLYEYPHD